MVVQALGEGEDCAVANVHCDKYMYVKCISINSVNMKEWATFDTLGQCFCCP